MPARRAAALAPVRGGHARSRSSGSRASGCPTGSARARTGGCRARSLAPILRFADVEAFVQESADGGKDGTELDGFAQIGVAKEDQPHYLKLLGRPEADLAALVDVRARDHPGPDREGRGSRREHGVIAPVRTYESPIDRRLEDAGFGTIATVTLLMKETLVRVAEPALVPAGVR